MTSEEIDATVASGDCEPLRQFRDVFEEELSSEISKRRTAAGFDDEGCRLERESSGRENLAGLALSGGGIRSATFCLGLLQAFHEFRLLRLFDYLSTVSGGGYVGGWWSAWLSRTEREGQSAAGKNGVAGRIFPGPEQIELDRAPQYLGQNSDQTDECGCPSRRVTETRIAEGSMYAGTDPIHHLRSFANYLTPRRGLLSGDTWRATSFFTRNLTMTWLILVPSVMAVILVGKLYFVPRPPETDPVVWASLPLIVVAAELLFTGTLWLIATTNTPKLVDKAAFILGLAVVAGVVYCVLAVLDIHPNWADLQHKYKIGFWVCCWAALAFLVVVHITLPAPEPAAGSFEAKSKQWRAEIRRARISSVHARFVAALVLLGGVLAVSGFGHKILRYGSYLFDLDSSTGRWLAAGSWVSFVIAAISGSIFTAYKAAPSPSGDQVKVHEPSRISKAVFAVTPPLLVSALVLAIAHLANKLSQIVQDGGKNSDLLGAYAPFFCVLVCIAFSILEMKWREFAPLGFLIPLGILVFTLGWTAGPQQNTANSGFLLERLATAAAVVVVFLMLLKLRPSEAEKPGSGGKPRVEWNIVRTDILRGNGNLIAWVVIGIIALVSIYFYLRTNNFFNLGPPAAVSTESGMGLGIDLGVAWILLLPSVAGTLVGGLILFRLAIVRRKNPKPAPNHQPTRFELVILKRWAENHRRGALWVLGLCCLVLAVSVDCVIHLVIAHQANDSQALTRFALLPILIALLGLLLLVLRTAAYELGPPLNRGRSALAPLKKLLERLGSWILRLLGYAEPTKRSVAWVRSHKDGLLRLLAGICLISSGWAGWMAHPPNGNGAPGSGGPQELSIASAILTPLFGSLILFKAAVVGVGFDARSRAKRTWIFLRPWMTRRRALCLWTLATMCILLAAGVGWIAQVCLADAAGEYHPDAVPLTSPSFIGIALCGTLVLFELRWGKADNRRPLWLLATAYMILVVLVTTSLSPSSSLIRPLFGLITAALVWVIGLGWMADPNAYSMHLFYKARLVRAYLGASNPLRRMLNKEITESVAGDNVLVEKLRNCDRGAPYHLINATLNLVAARDLATAQRSAAPFTLSRLFCGSVRTGFRETRKYMQGRISLGTAIAVSGAAASPNMGSRTPNLPMAMLLTILNVRLGYWVATPDRSDWQTPQARLWPFYLLREFLSNTNDLSDFCYLTDGGHFDNTGLYPLVERGCRFLVVADCGADPGTSFADLGNAIRRCRIDFGADIQLDLSSFRKGKGTKALGHFIKGKIVYSEAHLAKLGWKDVKDPSKRTGEIILFKPSLLTSQPDESADVRQYGFENPDFPQQATTNQWFDEAQFESYRRLGETCARSAFQKKDAHGVARDIDAIERLKEKIGRAEKLSLGDLQAVFGVVV